MNKIRPKRIIEGWKNTILGNHTTISDTRIETCNGCPNNKAGVCNICGCPLIAKTKVMQEFCPIDKWDDIKKVPDKGIAIRLHEVNKAKISVEEGIVTVTHNNTYKRNEAPENTLITLDFINARADLPSIVNKDIPLTNIYLKYCGCYEVRLNGKQADSKEKSHKVLDDAQHLILTFKYNTALDPNEYSMEKTIKVITDQGTIPIKFIGQVKEDDRADS